MGPVEYLIVEFPGNKFRGEIIPALKELTDNGTIHIIDLVFIHKDEEGNVTSMELSSLPPEEAALYDDLDGEIDDLLNDDDIMYAAGMLHDNSSAALLIYENVWATRLRDAITNANGILIDNARIPAQIVDEAMQAVAW